MINSVTIVAHMYIPDKCPSCVCLSLPETASEPGPISGCPTIWRHLPSFGDTRYYEWATCARVRYVFVSPMHLPALLCACSCYPSNMCRREQIICYNFRYLHLSDDRKQWVDVAHATTTVFNRVVSMPQAYVPRFHGDWSRVHTYVGHFP